MPLSAGWVISIFYNCFPRINQLWRTVEISCETTRAVVETEAETRIKTNFDFVSVRTLISWFSPAVNIQLKKASNKRCVEFTSGPECSVHTDVHRYQCVTAIQNKTSEHKDYQTSCVVIRIVFVCCSVYLKASVKHFRFSLSNFYISDFWMMWKIEYININPCHHYLQRPSSVWRVGVTAFSRQRPG